MSPELKHWLDYWDDLDRRFWACCRWFGSEFTPAQLAWQPIPQVASIGWNLWHLGEMLDHYLNRVFRATPKCFAPSPLGTMVDGARDQGQHGDLQEIIAYHKQVRPVYRQYLSTLTLADFDRPLSPGPRAHTIAWAVGHIAEHESYHLGKCTLLRSLLRAS